MTEENVAVAEPVQETLLDPVAVESAPAAAPEKKKRGRKPKAPPAPLPPPVVESVKPRKRKKANTIRLSATDRAFQSAIQNTENDRAKCIEEMSKIREMWDVKLARLNALDWKLGTLRGTTEKSSIAQMQLTPYGQPQPMQPQYINAPQMNYPPQPQSTYIPPAMRQQVQPPMPVEPRASGGSEGVIDDGSGQTGEEDQFLNVGGVVGGSRGWHG